MKATKLVLIALLLFFLSPAKSQTRLDSLKEKILTTPKRDQARVQLLVKYVTECYKDNPDSGFKYLKEIKEISDSINYKYGIIIYYREKSNYYRYKDKIDSALLVAFKYLEKSKESEDKLNTAEAHNSIAIASYFESDYNSAFLHFEKSLEIYLELKSHKDAASIYNNLAILYNERGNSKKALDYYLKGLKWTREAKNLNFESVFLRNIALIYLGQEQYDLALNYCEKSLELYKNSNNIVGRMRTHNLMGSTYFQLRELDKSLEFYNKGLEKAKELKKTRDEAASYQGIAQVLDLKEQEASAYKYYKKAIAIRSKLKSKNEYAILLTKFGGHLYKYKKYEKAISICTKSLAIGKELGVPDIIRDASSVLQKAHSKQDNYKEAYKHQLVFIQMRDSISNKENTRKLTEMAMKVEFDQKQREQELEQIAKDIETQRKIVRQRIMNYAITGALLFALVIALLLYRNFKRKKADNKLLSEKNTEIELQAKELEKLSAVASETENAVFICDTKTKIEWFNKGAEKLLGYEFEDFLKNVGDNLIDVSTLDNFSDLVADVIEQKRSQSYESLIVRKDGEKRWTQTTLSPIVSPKGKITKLITIDTDISRLKEYESDILQKSSEIEAQRDELWGKNKQIRASINYAQSIQNVILPAAKLLNKIGENGIIYRPKDIVSGDFYWATETEAHLFFAVADCTGHGVPGGFMSMISSTILNNLVNKERFFDPAKILTQLDRSIKKSLNQKRSNNNDGLDVCLFRIDKNEKTIVYSSAKQTIWLLSNDDEINRIKGDRYSIGGYSKKEKTFTTHTLPSDTKRIFLLSDGYADQCNAARQKIGSSGLLKVLNDTKHLHIHEQTAILDKHLKTWMQKAEQRDDITFVGFML